jgi:hypothetical protein
MPKYREMTARILVHVIRKVLERLLNYGGISKERPLCYAAIRAFAVALQSRLDHNFNEVGHWIWVFIGILHAVWRRAYSGTVF